MFHRLKTKIRQVLDHLDEVPLIRHTLLETMSPVDRYCALSTQQRFTGDYEIWRVKRIAKVLELLGPDWDWKGKRVLELGSGFGDIGAFFADAGADVVCVEGRVENLSVAKLRHRKLTNIKFVHRNIETGFSDLGRFDVIIHFGLLYHIDNVDENLRACAGMSDRIFLETEVLDSQDDKKVFVIEEDGKKYDTGLARKTSMISALYIKRIFEERGMAVDVIADGRLNWGPHIYDWKHKNDGSWQQHRRRFFNVTRGR
jgi:SAM-dependent methyltransferase